MPLDAEIGLELTHEQALDFALLLLRRVSESKKTKRSIISSLDCIRLGHGPRRIVIIVGEAPHFCKGECYSGNCEHNCDQFNLQLLLPK